jgi:transposase-like protein
MGDENVRSERELLSDIARWTRELAIPLLRTRAAPLLETDSKRRVYQAMESGTASVKTIETTTGANHNDVRTWVKVWEAEGIAEPGANPPKATFTLRELGIEAPPPKAARPTKAKA